MANSETGHAKNIYNFNQVTKTVESWGTDYKPSKAAIKVANLKLQFTSADDAQTLYGDKIVLNGTDKNLRKTGFKPVNKLSTKLFNGIKATDASDATIADAEGFWRKIQGERAEEKPKPTTDATGKLDDNSHSVAQLSYSNIAEHLKGLNKVLISEPSYNPAETELKTATITTLVATLKTLNDNESTSFIAMKNAKTSRDTKLYTPKTGIIDTVEAIKDYVKSVWGISSPQYKQIAKFKFSLPR